MAMMESLAGLDMKSFGLFSGFRRRQTLLVLRGERAV